ncbi:DUF6879 family protein [Actinomadura sp. 6K520]|uniref:DUF6879 family protein n=1 Tax=Actinomadura sp. 6K520 TaxID=2530364 RepID=UPI001FB57833|nr:DUF6879 family protein [Actinomadura sp. 6K520]
MHQPPAWALDSSERLTLDGFLKSFGEAWACTERRFLKLECWQSYREADGVRSQDAFQAGNAALARSLLEEEAMGDQPLRDEVKARNLEFTRVRLLSYPLTAYLHYEMINYEVRSRLGEDIEFFVPPSPVESHFDFLLFDSHTALIHDYGNGPVGHQTGGWLSHHAETLEALAGIVTNLRTHSEQVRPLEGVVEGLETTSGPQDPRPRRDFPQ